MLVVVEQSCGPTPTDRCRMSQLLSIGPFVPYDGIDHAGGEYLLRHVRELSETYQVTVVAPATAANRAAAAAGGGHAKTMLVPRSRVWTSRLLTPVRGLVNTVHGPTLGIDFERRALASADFVELVKSARVIELQWTETAGLSKSIRRLAPATPQIMVAYDMVSQKLDRRWRATRSPLLRLANRWRWSSWTRSERKILEGIDHLIVFSEKDADLARTLAPRVSLTVVHPPLDEPSMPDSPVALPQTSTALFAAAFGRPENSDSALWFLSQIWPIVRAQVPEARLVLAGSNPSDAIRAAAAAAAGGGVEVTGFVESLDHLYSQADVAVVPLLRGAGVKFKTIVAMLWGVPVVATPIGAEGVGDESHYVEVTSDASVFAAAVSAVLTKPASATAERARAFEWAHGRYSNAHFAETIQKTYQQLEAGHYATEAVSPERGLRPRAWWR